MSHRNSFERYAQNKDVAYDTVDLENGKIGFKFYQSIENGPRLLLGVIFNSDDTIVDLTIYNIAKLTNPLKKENYLHLVNELNDNYRYTKFVVTEELEVNATYSMILPTNNYDFSSDIFDSLIMILQTVEDSFPKFMRLQWS